MYTYDPARALPRIMEVNPFTPLAVVHRRSLLDRTGTFDETLWFEDDWDLWKRFARAGAQLQPVARKSGLYHVRATSQARTKRAPDVR